MLPPTTLSHVTIRTRTTCTHTQNTPSSTFNTSCQPSPNTTDILSQWKQLIVTFLLRCCKKCAVMYCLAFLKTFIIIHETFWGNWLLVNNNSHPVVHTRHFVLKFSAGIIFLILAHLLYKMCIIQETNTLDLWKNLQFVDDKFENI